jgi:hypothetical protein
MIYCNRRTHNHPRQTLRDRDRKRPVENKVARLRLDLALLRRINFGREGLMRRHSLPFGPGGLKRRVTPSLSWNCQAASKRTPRKYWP